jgi:CelD/BcsL family acetyltransferase involved in cellulose biosynthesis
MKTFNARIDGYQVRVSRKYDLDLLRQRWVKIQSGRNVPFFLTWSWIKIWIETYDPEYLVVSAAYKNEVVAIGLLTYSNEFRHKFVLSKQLRLHQIGDQLMDQIWMEYNDFLSCEQHQVKAVNACLKALQHDMFEWDEIVLSMMSLNRGQEIAQSYEHAFIDVHRTCYAANLKNIKASGKNYLQSLRANTRYQIRRSIRRYEEKYGKIKLMIAQNRDESIEYFRQAGPLHIERWEDSGYKNKQFIEFHENLIRESDDHQIDFISVRAGETTIAIMYYHIVGKNVYFYLHGLKYDNDAKLKPGLVAHSLASQHYLEAGMDKYDYMGGYSQYKLQLAERIEDLVTVCIQKPKLRFAIENFGRNVKQFIFSRN